VVSEVPEDTIEGRTCVKASNLFIIILTVLLCKARPPVRLRALSQSTDSHAQQDVHLHVPVNQYRRDARLQTRLIVNM